MPVYAHVYQGQHDYSRHPFVSIGMEAIVHKKPHKRQTLPNTAKRDMYREHRSSTTGAKDLDDGIACLTHIRSSVVQAQMLDQPIGHASGLHHNSHWRARKNTYYLNTSPTSMHHQSLTTARHQHRVYHYIPLTNPLNPRRVGQHCHTSKGANITT